MASSFVENSALRARIRFFQVCLAEINTLNAGVLNADQAAALQNTNRYLSRRLESARTGSHLIMHLSNALGDNNHSVQRLCRRIIDVGKQTWHWHR